VDRIAGRTFASRSEVLAPHAMAATSQPLATQAAVAVLRDGGSAVDAAIAANAVLGVVEPTGAGIGGDLFALVWDPETGKLHGLNGSGRSPAALSLDHFRALRLSRIPSFGPLPVSVPGAVDGWFALHGRFGLLPMERLLAPAIGYAREGFPVSEVIAGQWAEDVVLRERFPNFLATFAPGGRAPRKGERFRNPDLARTLTTITREGRDAFYRGEIARAINLYMKRAGGFLSADDLAAHTSTWVEPVSTTYRGHEVWELPPNGQGIAVLQMLNLLEGYDLAGMGFGSADFIHTFVEAKKLAFADRVRWCVDPDFQRIPVPELISKAYAAERRKAIDPRRAALTAEAGRPHDGDTVYLATADAQGSMVSLIQSNYRGMGSGMTPDVLGFVLQDRGELFDLTPGRPNSYAPGKRPFHTIIPGFLTRAGQPVAAFGVMGGDFQPQGHVQILVNLLDFGMNLQEAGDAPRILHEGPSEPTGERMTDGGRVCLESGIPWETIRDLIGRGHQVGWNVGDYGGYQAIRRDAEQRVYCGASESRKDGQAAGY
jgi:gamma-glutamyltranspeptidase / glutathione hydrolase